MVVPRRQRERRRFVPPAGGVPDRSASPGAVVPYDYAAKFELTGRTGNIVEDVINISAEAVFIATAIGYGFEEQRGRPLDVDVQPQAGQPSGLVVPGDITLGELPSTALIEGFRFNPRSESVVFLTEQPGPSSVEKRLSNQQISIGLIGNLLQRVKPPEDISFLFSVVDSGSGRELQDEPTNNLASLGKSNGERPFRMLAQPMTFLPRSTIRLQVIERSEGVTGTLFIVMYGYKLLAPSSCPESVTRSLTGSPVCPTETIGSPSSRVIPFDYVATVELTGRPGNIVEDEVAINVEGGFVATALGYALAVQVTKVNFEWERAAEVISADRRRLIQPIADSVLQWRQQLEAWRKNVRSDPSLAQPAAPAIDLGALPLRLIPLSALSDGLRIRPGLVRLAFENNGRLASALSADLADKLFERLNRPEDLSFRYSILDTGRGIEMQNQPINNIAGLGIANGDRPFKKFARPMIFLPRSTIRVVIEERFGRGRLFLVFQGYKLLTS